MPSIGSLITLAAGKAKRAEVNSNFATIRTAVNTYAAWVDQSATISGAWTFSTSPTISGALSLGSSLTVANGLTVTAGGATVTAGGLTVTAGGITVTAGGVTVAADGIAVTGASTFADGLTVTGTVAATAFSGDGSALTNVPAPSASAISTGTLNNARLPSAISVASVATSGDVTAGGDVNVGSDVIFGSGSEDVLFGPHTSATAVMQSEELNIDNHGWVLSGILNSDQSRYVKLLQCGSEEWYVRIDRKA